MTSQANELKKGSSRKTLKQLEELRKRKLAPRNTKKKRSNLNDTTVVSKATLDEEIKDFKAIVRHIFKHEAKLAKRQMDPNGKQIKP